MSLHERLGATEGIRSIISDVVDNHLANPAVSPRFQNMKLTPDELKTSAGIFFIMGTGGPNEALGKDMFNTRIGMNISAVEFMAVIDDVLAALVSDNVEPRAQEAILFILYISAQK